MNDLLIRSLYKVDIFVRKMYSKDWLVLKLKPQFGNELVPSFEEWFWLIQGLIYCETIKYKNRVVDPKTMVIKFFNRCFDEGITWEQIREEFKIPERRRNF